MASAQTNSKISLLLSAPRRRRTLRPSTHDSFAVDESVQREWPSEWRSCSSDLKDQTALPPFAQQLLLQHKKTPKRSRPLAIRHAQFLLAELCYLPQEASELCHPFELLLRPSPRRLTRALPLLPVHFLAGPLPQVSASKGAAKSRHVKQ